MKILVILCAAIVALNGSSSFGDETSDSLIRLFSTQSIDPFSGGVEVEVMRSRLDVVAQVQEAYKASPKEGLAVLQQIIAFLREERLKYKPGSNADAEIEGWLATSVAIQAGKVDNHRGVLVYIGKIKQQFESKLLKVPAFNWFDHHGPDMGFGNKEFGKVNSLSYDMRGPHRKIILPSLNNSSNLEDSSNVAYVIPDVLLEGMNIKKENGEYTGEMKLSISHKAAAIKNAYNGINSEIFKKWKWEDIAVKGVYVFYGSSPSELSFGSFRTEAIKCEMKDLIVTCPILTNDRMRHGFSFAEKGTVPSLGVTLYLDLNATERGGNASSHSEWNINLESMTKLERN